MRLISFDKKAFNEYQNLIIVDKKMALKISEQIEDILRNPFTGLGKPEALKGNFKGFWSRRITQEHRLIYKVTDLSIIIISCNSHYGDK